jgi:hypothetical protein
LFCQRRHGHHADDHDQSQQKTQKTFAVSFHSSSTSFPIVPRSIPGRCPPGCGQGGESQSGIRTDRTPPECDIRRFLFLFRIAYFEGFAMLFRVKLYFCLFVQKIRKILDNIPNVRIYLLILRKKRGCIHGQSSGGVVQ